MKCDNPFFVNTDLQRVPVPCGRCAPCKIRRVNSWVFRLTEEKKVSFSSHFVTLTYDTRTVPISQNGYMTLDKEDFQRYMKRLRHLCSRKIRYYAVGEYGSTNHRPHYHAIIFNVEFPALFSDAWGLGSVHVGTVTDDSMAYCMKYIDKPPDYRVHARDDRKKEFALMSNGIGASYITDESIRYHRADLANTALTKPGGYLVAMPRYYSQKIYTPDQIIERRHMIDAAMVKQENADRRAFSVLGYPLAFSYEEYDNLRRLGRSQNFFTNQKKRDVL